MSMTLLLALGCQGQLDADEIDPVDTFADADTDTDADSDADSDADETNVTFTNAPITYADRVDEEIVTNEIATDNVVFNVSDGDEFIFSEDTVYSESLELGQYTAQVDHYDSYGVHWISDPVDIDSADVEFNLCVDLTGTWSCYMIGYESNVDDEEIEMTSCTANTTMDDDVMMDGYHFTSDDYDGFVTQDGLSLDLNVYSNSGDLFGQFVCDKL